MVSRIAAMQRTIAVYLDPTCPLYNNKYLALAWVATPVRAKDGNIMES